MDTFGMSLQVLPVCFCPMYTPSIHDEHHLATNVSTLESQEPNHILSSDTFPFNASVKSNPTSRGKGNGTNYIESNVTIPLVLYRCLSSGCPCPSYKRLEHESTLIQKDDTSPNFLAFFLYADTSLHAHCESVPRPLP